MIGSFHVRRDKTPIALFLGQGRWTEHAKQALRFASRAEAERWIADERKAYPKMYAGAEPLVVETKSALVPIEGTVTAVDFDPYREGVV